MGTPHPSISVTFRGPSITKKLPVPFHSKLRSSETDWTVEQDVRPSENVVYWNKKTSVWGSTQSETSDKVFCQSSSFFSFHESIYYPMSNCRSKHGYDTSVICLITESGLNWRTSPRWLIRDSTFECQNIEQNSNEKENGAKILL